MNKFIYAFAVVVVLFGTTDAQAGGKLVAGGSLLTFSGAYTTTNSTFNDETLDGGAVALSYEAFIGDNPSTLAVWIGYNSSDGTGTGANQEQTTVDYQGLPVLIGGRFFFNESAVAVYVGFGAGVQFGTAKVTFETLPTIEDSESNFVMGLPIGIFWFVGEKTYINLSYMPYYVANSAYLDNITNTFAAGVGFAFR